MQAKLNKKLGPDDQVQVVASSITAKFTSGCAEFHDCLGAKLIYVEGWKVINLANEVFGFNGWSSSVLSITTEYIDYLENTQRYNVGVSVVVRVTLQDGAFREDVGFGALENARGKGVALEKCKKEAVTDGLKRTLRNFGNLLGNCLYDKQYASEILKVKAPAAKLDKNALYRHPNLTNLVPTIHVPGAGPQSLLASSPQNQPTDTTKHQPVGNPSSLTTPASFTNHAVHNLPTPNPTVEHPSGLTAPPSHPAMALCQSRQHVVSPLVPAAAKSGAFVSVSQQGSKNNLFDHQLAIEPTSEGSMYGSDDDAFFENIPAAELDMEVALIPLVPTPMESVRTPAERPQSPVIQSEQMPTSDLILGSSTSAHTISNPGTSKLNPSCPATICLADAIRSGAPGLKSTISDKRVAHYNPASQKRQRTS